MKITILGAGALGSILGIKLTSIGNDVTLVDVSPELIAEVRANGGIFYNDHTTERLMPVKIASYNELNEIPELVILVTKAMHTSGAMKSAAKIIGKDTYVFTLQNGLGNIEAVSEFVDESKILVGTTTEVAVVEGVGRISSKGEGHTEFMAANGIMNDMVTRINDMFNASNIKTDISEDIMRTIWEKVAHNSATNTLASVCRLPNAHTIGTEETRDLASKIIHEVCSVANALGIPADGDAVTARVIKHASTGGGFHFPSMAQDVFAHRKTEVSSINGAVYAKAKEVGVPVPYTETMYRIVRCIEEHYDKQHMVSR
jgi:2-dehydropantoate 2-reductase